MSITLGIDFGTTKTMASWVNPRTGNCEPVRLGRGQDYTPTSVFVQDNGSMLFGDDAEDAAPEQPARYCRGFKMMLGHKRPVLTVFRDGELMKQYSAIELTTAFLRHVREFAEKHAVMQAVESAVITHPVLFSPAQVEDLRIAAEAAGFKQVEFVTEPQAAGHAFCTLSPEEAFRSHALVVDWGGGTLDLVPVSRDFTGIRIDRSLAGGDAEMGGDEMDSLLWQHVCRRLQEQGCSMEGQPHRVRLLAQRQVRRAKEDLSVRESVILRLALAGSETPAIPLAREDFESIIRHSVDKAAGLAATLREKAAQCGKAPELLLLVGGTCRIPLVKHTLETALGLPACTWQYVREAVAMGAALWHREPAARKPQPEQPATPATTLSAETARKMPVTLNGEAPPAGGMPEPIGQCPFCKQQMEGVQVPHTCPHCNAKLHPEHLGMWGSFWFTFKKGLSLRGRATRRETWSYLLFSPLASCATLIMGGLLTGVGAGETWGESFIAIAILVANILLALAGIGVTVRRMHDTGTSGWFFWVFILFCPIFLVFLFRPSQRGANTYGPSVRYPNG